MSSRKQSPSSWFVVIMLAMAMVNGSVAAQTALPHATPDAGTLSEEIPIIIVDDEAFPQIEAIITPPADLAFEGKSDATSPAELQSPIIDNGEASTVSVLENAPAQLGRLSILSDGQFPYGPNVDGFSAREYLQQHAPHMTSIGELLDNYGDHFSINPRIYLTLIEMQTGLVSGTDLSQLDSPFGLSSEGVLAEIVAISETMTQAFYEHLHQHAAKPLHHRSLPAFQLGNESSYAPSKSLNSGSYAIYAAVAKLKDNRAQMHKAVQPGSSTGFLQTYQRLFPKDDPLSQTNQVTIPGIVTAMPPPDLFELPYARKESWIFGPIHAAAGGSDMSSLDFAKGSTRFPDPGTDTSSWIVRSSHAGKVESITGDTYKCQVRITHRDGWQTVYLHLNKLTVKQGDTISGSQVAIGTVANNAAEGNCFHGGLWTNPHLHFTVREPSGALVMNLNDYWFSGAKLVNKASGPTYLTCPTNVMWFEKGWAADKLRYCMKSGQASASLQLQNNRDANENRVMNPGSTLTAGISSGDRDMYFLQATQGRQTTVRLNAASGSSLDPHLYVYSPDGQRLVDNNDSDGGRNARITFTPATSGRYIIIATGNGNSTGNYVLSASADGAISCPDGQYKAEYFTNRNLSGSPAVTRCESSINYDWGTGSPVSGVSTDNFSVRWTGRHSFAGGTTRFIAMADDGIRVYLDGTRIIDAWRDQGATEYRTDRSVSAGMREVKVEYYENGGNAVARLRWEQVAASCNPNADQVALYVDPGHSGQCIVKGIGSYINPAAIGLPNDSVSSVRVGSNVRLLLFEHDGYQGRSSTFTGDDGNLSDNSIGDNSVSSMKVESSQGNDHTPPAGYSFCAYEGQRCSFSDRRDVAYGARGVFSYRNSVTGGIDCNNATFGDPIKGVKKACFTKSAPGDSGNLARGKQATATSQESSSHSPGKGNDGSNSTRWSSTNSSSLGGQRWYVDLGSAQLFNRVKINWEAAYAATYRVVWSDDGVNWYYSGSDYSRSGSGWADHSIGARTRRFVGVTMVTRAPRMNNYSFFEFEVYNSTRSADDQIESASEAELLDQSLE